MLSVVAVVVSPSPQSIVYLSALPTTDIVNVTVKGLPPELLSTVASTLLTYVLFLIFSVTSFNLSIASATVVELVKLVTLPGLLKLPSPPEPSVILYAFVDILDTSASN